MTTNRQLYCYFRELPLTLGTVTCRLLGLGERFTLFFRSPGTAFFRLSFRAGRLGELDLFELSFRAVTLGLSPATCFLEVFLITLFFLTAASGIGAELDRRLLTGGLSESVSVSTGLMMLAFRDGATLDFREATLETDPLLATDPFLLLGLTLG